MKLLVILSVASIVYTSPIIGAALSPKLKLGHYIDSGKLRREISKMVTFGYQVFVGEFELAGVHGKEVLLFKDNQHPVYRYVEKKETIATLSGATYGGNRFQFRSISEGKLLPLQDSTVYLLNGHSDGVPLSKELWSRYKLVFEGDTPRQLITQEVDLSTHKISNVPVEDYAERSVELQQNKSHRIFEGENSSAPFKKVTKRIVIDVARDPQRVNILSSAFERNELYTTYLREHLELRGSSVVTDNKDWIYSLYQDGKRP